MRINFLPLGKKARNFSAAKAKGTRKESNGKRVQWVFPRPNAMGKIPKSEGGEGQEKRHSVWMSTHVAVFLHPIPSFLLPFNNSFMISVIN